MTTKKFINIKADCTHFDEYRRCHVRLDKDNYQKLKDHTGGVGDNFKTPYRQYEYEGDTRYVCKFNLHKFDRQNAKSFERKLVGNTCYFKLEPKLYDSDKFGTGVSYTIDTFNVAK